MYEVVGEDVIQVVNQKQDCWLLWMPPSVTLDGTQGREETYWVDKDTGVPLKLHGKGWALDGSFGWEGEDVLVNTNIDLGPESTQPPSPTYTLSVPATPGFPETGKFWSWYVLEDGWYMRGTTNVTYYTEGVFTWWAVEVTSNEALVKSIVWYEQISLAESVEELEAAVVRNYNYTINVGTREILKAAGSLYRVNMTSLTYTMENRTPLLAGDIGEKTYCWLPTNLNIGASVNISWTHDWPSSVDNGTYTVMSEQIISALGKPQVCSILYMPPTPSQDGTQILTETFYSDKDVGIALRMVSKGWANDGTSAYKDILQFADTNVDLGSPALGAKATIDIIPDVLNLRSRGRSIIAYIELSEGFNASDIDVSKIKLNGTIPVDIAAPITIGDYDNDTVSDLMVNFNTTAVSQFIISKGFMYGNVTLTISGQLNEGTLFEGNDVIKVRMPGDTNIDGKVDGKDIAFAAKAFASYPGHPRWNYVADENEDNKIEGKDLVLIAKNFGKTYT